MCQPFNEHQPIRDEFHGLLMYVVAVSSVYFMVHVYRPKPQTSKKSTQINSQASNGSSSNLEYRKTHRFREEQRAKYGKYKNLKKKTQDDKGSQGSLLGRSLTFKGLNITPMNTPRMAKRNSMFSTQSSSMSSMRTGESSVIGSNELLLQIPKKQLMNESNMFSYHNQSTPSSLNSKRLRFQETRDETRATSLDPSVVYPKKLNQATSKYLANHRQSYDDHQNSSEVQNYTLSRHNAFDTSNGIDSGPNHGAQKQKSITNVYRNTSKSDCDRKISLRRKALSVEMIRHSSEEK